MFDTIKFLVLTSVLGLCRSQGYGGGYGAGGYGTGASGGGAVRTFGASPVSAVSGVRAFGTGRTTGGHSGGTRAFGGGRGVFGGGIGRAFGMAGGVASRFAGTAGTRLSPGEVVQSPVISQHVIEVVDLPSSGNIEPIRIEVGASRIPVDFVMRSVSSDINVQPMHESSPGSQQETQSEDEAHVLRHSVTKPIIQEVREVITPIRTITQEVQPVQEDILTIVSRDSGGGTSVVGAGVLPTTGAGGGAGTAAFGAGFDETGRTIGGAGMDSTGTYGGAGMGVRTFGAPRAGTAAAKGAKGGYRARARARAKARAA